MGFNDGKALLGDYKIIPNPGPFFWKDQTVVIEMHACMAHGGFMKFIPTPFKMAIARRYHSSDPLPAVPRAAGSRRHLPC